MELKSCWVWAPNFTATCLRSSLWAAACTNCMLQETEQMHCHLVHNPHLQVLCAGPSHMPGSGFGRKRAVAPLGAPSNLATWQEELLISKVTSHAGLMTTLTQKPSLPWHLSSKSKQDDQEGGQQAASYQCSQQSLAPGESHTGHLARPWWMHMLCLHWHCQYSSASPERNHALCFSCSLWSPLWEVQPQLHFGNNLPAPTQKPSTLSQTMAENLQSRSSPSTCPQFKLPGAEGCLEPEMALGTYMRLLGVAILHPSV